MNELIEKFAELRKLMVGQGLRGNFSVTLDGTDFDVFLAKSDQNLRAIIDKQGLRDDDISWFRSAGVTFYRRPYMFDN